MESKTVRRSAWVILLVLAVAGGGFWMFADQDSSENEDVSVAQAKIGVYKGEASALVYIAESQGYFRDAGLEVELVPFEAGRLAASALIDRDVDVVTATGFVLSKLSFENPTLRTFGTVSVYDTNRLIARQDRGIDEMPDMRGKSVAVTVGSSAEYYLARLLLSHGMTLQDVNVVNYSPSDLVEAVISGAVDAAATWEPNLENIRAGVAGATTEFAVPGAQLSSFILIAHSDWLSDNPTVAKRIQRAMIAAEKFIHSSPDAAKTLIAESTALDREYIDRIWPLYSFKVGLSQTLVVTLEDQTRWLAAQRDDEAIPPNVLQLIDDSALMAEDPTRVTIIR